MSHSTRRNFLAFAGAAGVSAALDAKMKAAASQPSENFTFLFVTDTHLQPELDAAKGCDMCFKQARGIKADFAIHGGDHIFDGLSVPQQRAAGLYDLYGKTQQDLGMKVHHTLGNHDCFGVFKESGVAPGDPLFGKKMFEDHLGKTYYSFDHKGVHFVVLDSIGITADRSYEGRIDEAQLAWLASDLRALPAGKPIVVSVHIPIVTAFDSYVPAPPKPPVHHGMSVVNSSEVIALWEGRNVLGVLQGHTHINETVMWKGVPYITSGAVSGNWWHGTRMGTPEGFTVVEIKGGKLSTRYETYGFHSIDPQNT